MDISTEFIVYIQGFVRELGAAERIYCREQTDYGNQTLVQAIILSNTNHITESKARQALIQLYHDYCPVLGYTVCSSDDQTTLVYKSKDRHLAEEHLMLNFKYEKVKKKQHCQKHYTIDFFFFERILIGQLYLKMNLIRH